MEHFYGPEWPKFKEVVLKYIKAIKAKNID